MDWEGLFHASSIERTANLAESRAALKHQRGLRLVFSGMCGIAALLMASAAANAFAATALLLPYGDKPLTIEQLKEAYGSKVRLTSYGCTPGEIDRDGHKCESWVVEKDVSLMVDFDYARYQIRAADNVVDSLELVKSGDCDEVIGAYTSLGNAARLSTYWEPVTPQKPGVMAYRIKPSTDFKYLKDSIIKLELRERQCSLTHTLMRR